MKSALSVMFLPTVLDKFRHWWDHHPVPWPLPVKYQHTAPATSIGKVSFVVCYIPSIKLYFLHKKTFPAKMEIIKTVHMQ